MEPRTVHYELTHFFFQLSLTLICVFAFSILVQQYIGLCCEKGLLPVRLFVRRVVGYIDSPSLFFFWNSDFAGILMAWVGLGRPVLALSGFIELFSTRSLALAWFLLWVIYLSFADGAHEFVRVRSDRHRFSDSEIKSWRRRELRGDYLTPISLRDGSFRKLLIDNGWLAPGGSGAE